MRFGVTLKEVCPLCGQDRPDPEAVLRIGPLEIKPIDGTVTLDGTQLVLTPTERRMLVLLATSPGQLVTWADLYEAGTGRPPDPSKRRQRQQDTIRVYTARLEAKLGSRVTPHLQHIRGPLTEGGVRLVVAP